MASTGFLTGRHCLLTVACLRDEDSQLPPPGELEREAGEGDDKLGPTIRFSLPLYVRLHDMDRTLGLIKSELLDQG